MSDPSVGTVRCNDGSATALSAATSSLHHTPLPQVCGVEADDFQTDVDRLCALLDAKPVWTHRSDRPSWHRDDCNGPCCWTRTP